MKLGNAHIVGSGIALLACLGGVGCGVEKPEDPTVASSDVATKQQFLTWNPGDTLVNEHTCWHYSQQCEAACTAGVFGRKCANQGEDFLSFHRNFLNRLRNEYERQGLTTDIKPWTTLPPQMKDPNNGWNSTVAAAETAVLTMTDPATNTRFASLNAYGSYIEANYHGVLHGIAAAAWSSTDSGIANITTSPTSTYFFKIHGYIDLLFQRFQQSDFNKDGIADIIEHDNNNGATQLWLITSPSSPSNVSQKVNIGTVNGCGYYIGAVADLDFDGNLDLIWHGPACNSVVFWKMVGSTHAGPDILLPNVDSNWKLVGAADYDSDQRPDLVWNYVGAPSSTLALWKMNGTTLVSGTVISDPVPGYRPVAPIDMNNDLVPDLLIKGGTDSAKIYKVLKMNGSFGTAGTDNTFQGIPTDTFSEVTGIGRFTSFLGGNHSLHSDLIIKNTPPAPSGSFKFGILDFANGTAASYHTVNGTEFPLAGQVFWGPR